MGFYLPDIKPPPNQIKSVTDNPVMKASYGRSFSRAGAKLQGTLYNWINSVISSRIAEREKRKVSDRSWDLYINDAMSHGLIESLLIEIIGTGLTPQAQPMLRWLNRNIEWQQQYQQAVYDIFELWGLDCRNFCDAQGRLNFYMMQTLALLQWKLDGIGVFQVTARKERFRPLSFALLPIDPSRLITPSDLQGSQDVYDGVALDDSGAIEGVWIANEIGQTLSAFASVNKSQCTYIPAYDSTTGLPNVLLVCDVRNVAEYRQDSILGSMIKEIKDSNDLVNASIIKTLLGNLVTFFIEDTLGIRAQTLTIEQRIQEIEAGTMIFGSQGEKPYQIENNAPGPHYDQMNNSIIGRLGMATARGPENIRKAYEASYSASQASIENAERVNDVDRMVLNNRFNQPALMLMQYEAALRGLLPDIDSITDFLDNIHAYSRAVWLPPPMKVIDRAKAAKADETRLTNNTRTYSGIYGEQSKDWRSELRQRAIEKAYIQELEDEYGVEMQASGIASGAAPDIASPEDTQND